MLSIFINTPSQSTWMLYISSLLSLGSGALVAWFASGWAYKSQKKLKQSDINHETEKNNEKLGQKAKDIIMYINMVLLLEASNLVSIKKFLEQYKSAEVKPKFTFISLIVSITQENIERFLSVKKFIEEKTHPEVLQLIIIAETVYRKCIAQLNFYNQLLSNDNIEKLNSGHGGLLEGVKTTIQGLEMGLADFDRLNGAARERLLNFARSVFGPSFVIPTLDKEIMKSAELYERTE